MEGDIILYEDYQDEYYYDAVEKTSRLWQKTGDVVKIPYELPVDISDIHIVQIDRAIKEFHLKTCIR